MFPYLISVVIMASNLVSQPQALATHSLSLTNRYAVPLVNEVFKYNILHTIERMGSEFVLEPGEKFAFHGTASKTTNSDFTFSQGFKSDGYLVGDGVCHLASLMYMAALEAGLEAIAPRNHNFAVIPDIPKEYGVSIFSTSDQNNLYITNNKPYSIKFEFITTDDLLTMKISQVTP